MLFQNKGFVKVTACKIATLLSATILLRTPIFSQKFEKIFKSVNIYFWDELFEYIIKIISACYKCYRIKFAPVYHVDDLELNFFKNLSWTLQWK